MSLLFNIFILIWAFGTLPMIRKVYGRAAEIIALAVWCVLAYGRIVFTLYVHVITSEKIAYEIMVSVLFVFVYIVTARKIKNNTTKTFAIDSGENSENSKKGEKT
jgi:uncharacterized BrkB/YihY/UPF0761 family membrane protein